MGRPLLRAGPLLGALLLAQGCGGSDGAGPEEPEEAGFSLVLAAGSLTLTRGESTRIHVTVHRRGGFAQPVAVTVTGAPHGVTVASGTVPAGAESAFLDVVSGETAAAGTATLTVEATAPGAEAATASLTLRVAGPPVPFEGTIFIDPDIITPDDPTTLVSVTPTGRGERRVYDRRAGWVTLDVHLFDVAFSDGLTAVAQVNPEFGAQDAEDVARYYADAVGRLPRALRRDVDALWIHEGVHPFGGGNRSLLIHTGQGVIYDADGILEETLAHEAAHTSLDADWASSAGWLAAQRDDGTFISTYARDNPTREDIAETFVPYIAVRYRADRIPAEMADAIRRAIPFRMAFLDSLGLDLGLLGGG